MAKPTPFTSPHESNARSEARKGISKDTDDIKTLYDTILQQEQVLHRVRKELASERLETARKHTEDQVIAMSRLELDLRNQGIALSAGLRREYLEQDAKEQEKLEKKRIIDAFKEKTKLEQTREDREARKQDRELNLINKRADILHIQDEIEKEQKKSNADQQKLAKLQKDLLKAQQEEKKAQKEAQKEEAKEKATENLEQNFKDLIEAIDKPGEHIGDVLSKDLVNTMKGVGKAITESLNQINNAISTYANYQTEINARLQGVGDFSSSVKVLSDVAFSPLIKTEELYANLSAMVGEGIASNVEQRAFLQTVKKGIATTFDANNQALKQIIRVQQLDTTAARLGLEAYLTRFLNEFVQNTEYLTTTFDSVSASLLQASSTMSGQQATEFEYQVQKWLSALTGVGLSDATANAIATAIGQLGSGDISGLSSSQMQNLMVMAASRSGNVNFAEMLTGGLNYNTTNYLMESVVTYLQELGSYSNNVVKSQLAQTFGVSMSDLMAMQNLSKSDIKTLLDNVMSYSGMYDELEYQMGKLKEREGISNILENLFSNLTFQTGMNIASNPALYATWKITDMIQGVTGGINIPFITAMGTGFDLNTTVENLMKLGIVGISTLGNLGDIISGVASVGNGASLLDRLGISATAGSNVTKRGSGLTSRSSGMSTSLSTMVGNTEGSDYYDQALTSASDDAQSKMAEAQSETNDYTQKIFELLDSNMEQRVNSIDENIGKIYDFISNQATYMSLSSEIIGLTGTMGD